MPLAVQPQDVLNVLIGERCRSVDQYVVRRGPSGRMTGRLLSALFESIDAEALPQRGLRHVAAPRGTWRGFFQLLVSAAGDGECCASTNKQGQLRG